MKNSGFYLIVITNQPDVARGDIQSLKLKKLTTTYLKTLLWITLKFVIMMIQIIVKKPRWFINFSSKVI